MQRADSLESDSGKDQRQKEKGRQRMKWLDQQLNGHESEQPLVDSEGQRSLVCCSPWGHKELDMIWGLNNNKNMEGKRNMT